MLGRQVLADVVGADRQLPVAAVDEHRELDRSGPAELEQRVERGARGAAGEEHVVDEHDDAAGDVGDLGRAERRDRAQADVVAVERDVEHADRDVDAFERRDRRRDAAAASATPRVYRPTSTMSLGAVVAFDDLVRDPGDGPAQVGGVEDPRAQGPGADAPGPDTTTPPPFRSGAFGLSGAGRAVMSLLRRDLSGSPSRSRRQ